MNKQNLQDLRKALTEAIVKRQKALEELNKCSDRIISDGYFIPTPQFLAEYKTLVDKERDSVKKELFALEAFANARDSA